jgi:RimJ/RimL family protein N-acetyltransferase
MERTIETARLLLRPMRAEDVDDLLAVFADPKVMAAFGVEPFDRHQMERWVGRNLEHQERYGYGLYSIIDKADHRLIGDCGLEHLDDDGTEAELGYDLRSDSWNQGVATEAATAVRDHAFRVLGLPRLISLIRQGNAASRRVAEKVGMRHAEDITRHGTSYWLYAISRHEAPQPANR